MESKEDKEEKEEEEISEGAEYSPKSEFSKPKLVEEAVRKCIEARSQEMKEGYNNYKLDSQGRVTAKIWIPDSRKSFDSHVLALRNLLSPEIKNNTKFKKVEEAINKKKKKIFESHCYTIKEQVRKDGRIVWVDTLNKIIPEKDAVVVCPDKLRDNMAVEDGGLWNSHVRAYWNELVKPNDELFSALNILIDSLNYFKQGVNY